MKIGIFGGSFNPVHLKHIAIARDLIHFKYVDKVIFVPTGDAYQKEGLAPAKDRLAMLNLVCDHQTMLVSDYEVQKGKQYTYQTLDYFQQLYPSATLYFILGLDNFAQFKTWKNIDYILKNYYLLVVQRPFVTYQDEDLLKHNHIVFADIAVKDVASYKIRQNIKTTTDLDESVRQYIIQNHLYK